MSDCADDLQSAALVLLEQASNILPASKQRRLARRMYGKAGEWNANGEPEMAEWAKEMASDLTAYARTQAAPDHAPDRLRFERLRWSLLAQIMGALDQMNAPPTMTVADLYYRLALYMEADTGNHDRRYAAWLKRSAAYPDTHDPYLTVRFIAGESFTVPPGQGDHGRPVRSKRDKAPPLETIRRWEARQGQRRQASSPPIVTATTDQPVA